MSIRKTTTREDYLRRMLSVLVHIQQHLDESLALDELAAVACFSPFHVRRAEKAGIDRDPARPLSGGRRAGRAR